MTEVERFDGTGNVLYLGMADDILTLLLLAPHARNYFVIDQFDSAFSRDGTLEGQREIIRDVLLNGSNVNCKHVPELPTVELDYGPAKIIEEIDLGYRWHLSFDYNNTRRELTVFFKDFTKEWPRPITCIEAIMGFGAYAFDYLIEPPRRNVLARMFAERTAPIWFFYVNRLYWMGAHFPVQFDMPAGQWTEKTEFSMLRVNRLRRGWFWEFFPMNIFEKDTDNKNDDATELTQK